MKPAGRFSLAVERPTSVLLGANVLVYLAMLAVGGRAEWSAFSTRTLMRFGAEYAPLVLEGQAQRLVTSMFLHLNPLHLLMNMAALVTIGPVIFDLRRPIVQDLFDVGPVLEWDSRCKVGRRGVPRADVVTV